MTALIGPILVVAFLAGIIAFMFRGRRGRVGRPPSGVMTRLRSPVNAPWAAAGMGGLAIGSAFGRFDQNADTQSGLLIGALVATLLVIPALGRLSAIAIGIVAVVLAIVDAYGFVAGRDGFDALSTAYRVLVIISVLAAFALGVLLGGHISALRGERGLELFGIVEVTTFLAAPSGRDALPLGVVTNTIYLPIACAIAGFIGWSASEYTLGALSIAVGITVWAEESIYGTARVGWVGIVAAVTAVVAVVVISKLFRRSQTRLE